MTEDLTLDLFPVRCDWCRELLATTQVARGAPFQSRRCRQAAFRLRRRRTTAYVESAPARFCYADPPYPGLAARYYKHEPTFAGEVDHQELVASLAAAGYAGWALSTSARALVREIPDAFRPLFEKGFLRPEQVRVCSWTKPLHPHPGTFGLHNSWEPLVVVGGRQVRPGKRDWLVAHPARGWGELPGRKPLAFCAWLFECLGLVPGDELVDLFPGTGAVGRAWAELSRQPVAEYSRDASPLVASSGDRESAVAEGPRDASARPRGAALAENEFGRAGA